MTNTPELLMIIHQLEMQKESLNKQMCLGIIDADGAREELAMISKKDKKLREQFVLEHHVTEAGTVRSISYHEPTESNPKFFYSTKFADGKKLKATTYDGLIEKLFTIYMDGISDFSVKSIFEAALLEKAATENPKQNTLIKNQADFNRFISDEFAHKDIRKITDIDLKKYTQKWVNKEHPKQKIFLSYKGVLNLVFGYAFTHRIISTNPVVALKNKPYMKSCDTRKAKPEEKILSPEEIDLLVAEVRHRMTKKKWGPYYINGYAMIFATLTGVRVGELCALKWENITPVSIHIHAQQLTRLDADKKNEYYYDPCTKNEKGISQDGRDFPLTKKIHALLEEIKSLQNELGIKSEYIFCHEDGDWIKTDAYETFLRRLCRSKNLNVTNNHALRMSLNSNVLIPKGISVADRAAMLGHSIETNLKYYSFAQKDYIGTVCAILDEDENEGVQVLPAEGTLGNPSKVANFPKRKASNY